MSEVQPTVINLADVPDVLPTWADIWDACERAYTPNNGERGRKVRRVVVSEAQYATLMQEHSCMPTSFSGEEGDCGPMVTDIGGEVRMYCSYGVVDVGYVRPQETHP